MALIKCPECSSDVSDQASSCPRCGHPILNSGISGRPQNTVKVQAAKSRGIYIILGLFLGCLGVHNFYAGYYGREAAQLIITSMFGWFVIGFVITAIWALIELFTVVEDANGDKMT